MSVLGTLRQGKASEWRSLSGYLRELRHRETGALGALASLLSTSVEEQRELGSAADAGPVLLEVACDLRVPKGARLAATRCLLEAGIEPPYIGQLFIGAGDLVTDPRLGGAARRLVEGGLPAAMQLQGEAAVVSMEAGSFARAAHAAASAVGAAKAETLLSQAPEGHAGAAAALFALGKGDLPAEQQARWAALLEETCARNRRAPAAAKRMGLAPSWPPNLPDAFEPLVRAAEEKNKSVSAADAAADRGSVVKRRAGAVGRALPAPVAAGPLKPGAGKPMPPIRQSSFPRATGAVEELPKTRLPPKAMEQIRARTPLSAQESLPRPRVEPGEARAVPSSALPVAPQLASRAPMGRFDPKGNPLPRPDRWDDDDFQWPEPILPSPVLPPPLRAQVAEGPFAQRVQSFFEDRPEAVDRLCAAVEARAALRGEDDLLRELGAELASRRWHGRSAPPSQLARLRMIADGPLPAPWRAAAALFLQKFPVPERGPGGSG